MAPREERDATSSAPLWFVATSLVGALLFLVSVPTATSAYEVPFAIAVVSSALACGALPVAARRPLLATGMQLVAAVGVALTAEPVSGQAWPLTIPGVLLLVAHVGIVSAHRDWRIAAGVWAACSTVFGGLVVAGAGEWQIAAAAITFVVYATNSMLVLVAGAVWRQRSRVARQLAAAKRDRDIEQNRRMLIEERSRIARELHDVVAHTMSVIHMQSSTARFRLSGLDDAARAEFDQIAGVSRAAMGEMRQLLGVLREEGAAPPRTPTPGLGDLADLATATSRTGTAVGLTVDDALTSRPLPESVQLAAYRIVQEALSNAVRHAPGARAEVDVSLAPNAIVVDVVNEAAPSPTAPLFDGAADDGRAGHGLVGMRERATLLGGWSTAGVDVHGGWRVTAYLPVPPVYDVPAAIHGRPGPDSLR